jgi:transcription initiation factor TFIIE subunit alpha
MSALEDPSVREYLRRLIGDEGIKVMEKISEEEITDEEIAEMSGVNLNVVRKTLYILYENRLADYRRERNEETGWLTYLWRMDLEKINQILRLETKKLMENLQRRFDFERNNVFYACESCGRFKFESAMETNFKCPNCGKDLHNQDNADVIKALEERISKLMSL